MTFSNFVSSFWPSTINGLVLGSIYALVALGYTMVYGVLRLINFANSEVFMLACFGSFVAVKVLDIPKRLSNGEDPVKSGWALIGVLALCLVISVTIGGIAAVVVEILAYRPLRRRNAPRLVFLISAIGASFAISEAIGEWGFPFITNKNREQYGLTRFFIKGQIFKVFGADVYDSNVIVVVGVAIMAVILIVFVDKTRVGRGIRAVAQDAETAKLMGVDVDRIILITFLVGGLMAGGAAFFYEVHLQNVRYNTGFLIGVKAFTAAVLGGIGNVRGALLGVIETWGASLFGADQNVGTIAAFVTLVLVLMFRPSGLLGESLGRSKA